MQTVWIIHFLYNIFQRMYTRPINTQLGTIGHMYTQPCVHLAVCTLHRIYSTMRILYHVYTLCNFHHMYVLSVVTVEAQASESGRQVVAGCGSRPGRPVIDGFGWSLGLPTIWVEFCFFVHAQL